jgi:hypothetical protein
MKHILYPPLPPTPDPLLSVLWTLAGGVAGLHPNLGGGGGWQEGQEAPPRGHQGVTEGVRKGPQEGAAEVRGGLQCWALNPKP